MELITESGEIETYPSFAWSLNYTTAEVVNLTGRKASYSKTIQVPYNRNNRAIFEGLQEINVDNVGYNTKKSLKCFVSHNGRVLMNGTVIVQKFYRVKEEWVIELQLISSIKNLITKLKTVKLNELDFSRWNHEYSASNIFNAMNYGTTFLNGVQQQFEQGKGYVYPLIDYGKSDVNGEIQWNVEELRPCLYLKEIVDTIFRFAGITYTSEFLDSPYFRSLVLENTISEILFTDIQKALFDTEVERQTVQKSYTDTGGYPTAFVVGGFPQNNLLNQLWSDTNTPLDFTNEVLDTQNQWDITLPIDTFTAQRNGTHSFKINAEFYHEFAVDANSVEGQIAVNTAFMNSQPITFTINPNGEIESHLIQVVKNGIAFDEIDLQAVSPLSVSQFFDWVNPTYPVSWVRQTGIQVIDNEFVIDLQVGDTISFRTFETARVSANQKSLIHRFYFEKFTVRTKVTETPVSAGDIINFGNYIPNIKADAFIDGLFNFFNLWILDDVLDENNMIVEPRTNIFGEGGYIDMTDKLDRSRRIESDFLADSLPRRYKYKFKASDDVLNSEHNAVNDLPYADFDSEVDIDFSNSERTIETIFSPLITQQKNGLYYPLEHSVDELGNKKNIGAFLKIGFVQQKQGDWEIRDRFNNVTQSQVYTLISEFDSIEQPIYSLTFGTPEAKFNQTGSAYWNAWRLFHQLTEEEQTRDGSLILSAFFNLNENDISNLDLRRAWFVDGVYFRIVSISNVNPETNTSTQVRLLQIDNPKFDFTSNEMIYRLAGIQRVLSTNDEKILTTNTSRYVQLD